VRALLTIRRLVAEGWSWSELRIAPRQLIRDLDTASRYAAQMRSG
jgi:hypothetical protein